MGPNFRTVSAEAIPTYIRDGRPAARERGLQLSLQRIEHLSDPQGRHRVPHRHPYHVQVMWIEAGESECFCDGRVYRLRAGELYGLPAGVVHACGANDTLRGWVLHCVPELLAERPSDVLTALRRGRLATDTPEYAEVARWFEGFAAEYAQLRPGRGAAVRAWLRLLGAYLGRLSPKPDLVERPRPVSVAFRELLDRDFARERNPAVYAATLGITGEQLNARLREETGAAAREHIDRRVALEAERLLAFTALPVAEVAARLGFEDPDYFYRYFRKHVGATPGEWRARQRQDFANAGAPGLELPFGNKA